MIARANANQDSNEDVDQLRDGAASCISCAQFLFAARRGDERRQARQACRCGFHAGTRDNDSNNLFGALEFSDKLAKEGVQPIVGMQSPSISGCGGDGPAARRMRAVRPSCSCSGRRRYLNLMYIARVRGSTQTLAIPACCIERLEGEAKG